MIELARNYDVQVKAMHTAEDDGRLQHQAAAEQLTRPTQERITP